MRRYPNKPLREPVRPFSEAFCGLKMLRETFSTDPKETDMTEDDDGLENYEWTSPLDEGAPLPPYISSERQPPEVLEPHLSHSYAEALHQNPEPILRLYVAGAILSSTTPRVAKEAWALCHVIADRIAQDKAAARAEADALREENARLRERVVVLAEQVFTALRLLESNVRTDSRDDQAEQRLIVAFRKALKEPPHDQ